MYTKISLVVAVMGMAAAVSTPAIPAGEPSGESLYAHCSNCHGSEGEGGQGGKYPRIAGLPQAYIERQLEAFKNRKRINKPMLPVFKDWRFDQRAIRAVATQVAAMPTDTLDIPPFEPSEAALAEFDSREEFDTLGEDIFVENCAQCHGENGLGREITRQETEQILKESADAGLVHGISNWKDKPDTICNCCSCCCLWMEAYHKLGHHKSLDASNYRLKVKPETCKACGLCVKRCPMDAIQLKFSEASSNKFEKAPVLDEELCLGCGVCVHKCPTDSLTLERKDEIVDPPRDIRDYGRRFMEDKKTGVKLLR